MGAHAGFSAAALPYPDGPATRRSRPTRGVTHPRLPRYLRRDTSLQSLQRRLHQFSLAATGTLFKAKSCPARLYLELANPLVLA